MMNDWSLLFSGRPNDTGADAVLLGWRQPSMWRFRYLLFANGADPVAEAAMKGWTRRNMDATVFDGQQVQLRRDGGLFTTRNELLSDGQPIGSWETAFALRWPVTLRGQQYTLGAERLFSGWVVLRDEEKNEIARVKPGYDWFRSRIDLRFYPQNAPQLRPSDWMALAVMLLHITIYRQARRSSR